MPPNSDVVAHIGHFGWMGGARLPPLRWLVVTLRIDDHLADQVAVLMDEGRLMTAPTKPIVPALGNWRRSERPLKGGEDGQPDIFELGSLAGVGLVDLQGADAPVVTDAEEPGEVDRRGRW